MSDAHTDSWASRILQEVLEEYDPDNTCPGDSDLLLKLLMALDPMKRLVLAQKLFEYTNFRVTEIPQRK